MYLFISVKFDCSFLIDYTLEVYTALQKHTSKHTKTYDCDVILLHKVYFSLVKTFISSYKYILCIFIERNKCFITPIYIGRMFYV
jgi:hypothetical protein